MFQPHTDISSSIMAVCQKDTFTTLNILTNWQLGQAFHLKYWIDDISKIAVLNSQYKRDLQFCMSTVSNYLHQCIFMTAYIMPKIYSQKYKPITHVSDYVAIPCVWLWEDDDDTPIASLAEVEA